MYKDLVFLSSLEDISLLFLMISQLLFLPMTSCFSLLLSRFYLCLKIFYPGMSGCRSLCVLPIWNYWAPLMCKLIFLNLGSVTCIFIWIFFMLLTLSFTSGTSLNNVPHFSESLFIFLYIFSLSVVQIVNSLSNLESFLPAQIYFWTL